VSRLASLQAAFAAAMQGAPLDDGLLRTRRDGRPHLFGAYRHAYSSHLKEALRENYPVLCRALGDDAFDAVAEAYVACTPSRTPSIRWYGGALADWMARDGADVHPALADLAKLEWALREAFDAADDPVADAAQLAQVAGERWPDLRFALHASARVIQLDWTVEPAWRALDRFVPGGEEAEPEVPEPVPHPHSLLVWRRGLQPTFRSLEEDEALAFEALRAGASFGEMCAQLAERAGDEAAGLLAVGFLRQWLTDELLSGWRVA
jgi:hypothetical protein